MKHLKGASDWHLVQFTGGWISGNSLQKKIRRLRGLIHHLIGPMREGSGWLTNEEIAVHFSPLCPTFLHCVFSPLWLFCTVTFLQCDFSPLWLFSSVSFLHCLHCDQLFSSVTFLHCDFSPVCPTHQLSRSTRDPPTLQQRPPILVNILIATSKSSINTNIRIPWEGCYWTTITSENDLTLFYSCHSWIIFCQDLVKWSHRWNWQMVEAIPKSFYLVQNPQGCFLQCLPLSSWLDAKFPSSPVKHWGHTVKLAHHWAVHPCKGGSLLPLLLRRSCTQNPGS